MFANRILKIETTSLMPTRLFANISNFKIVRSIFLGLLSQKVLAFWRERLGSVSESIRFDSPPHLALCALAKVGEMGSTNPRYRYGAMRAEFEFGFLICCLFNSHDKN